MSALRKISFFLLVVLLMNRKIDCGVVVTTTDDPDITTATDDDSSDEEEAGEDWREDTLIYHIWPRSFQDSDGDGVGDLQGIISRLNYLVEIGVDTIRLSPIYASPMVDSGYDISNHTDVDPSLGDLNDFDELVHEAHSKDLKIILDVVPNHSSTQHEWYEASTKNEEPYDDFYLWADGRIVDNKVLPPNNWKNAYSDEEGSAWTFDKVKRKWYYHRFHHTEPDFNLRNEEAVEAILEVFDFWLDKGVDGFCILGVSYLVENEELLDEVSDQKEEKDKDACDCHCPGDKDGDSNEQKGKGSNDDDDDDDNEKNDKPKKKRDSDNRDDDDDDDDEKNDNDSKPEEKKDSDNDDDDDDKKVDDDSKSEEDDDDDDDDNSQTIGLSENARLLYRFREHIDQWAKDHDEKPKLLIGEVDKIDDDIHLYYGNETHPGIAPVNLIFITKLNETSDADDIKTLVDHWMSQLPTGMATNWMLSNQDFSRASSRLNPELLDGLYMLALLLPGQAITYYGEEIGMVDGNVTWEDTLDLRALERPEENYEEYSRDPFRTPMQWDDTISSGFSTNETTFLPVNADYEEMNVKKQLDDPDSNLEAFKKLSMLRENPIFTRGDYELTVVENTNVLVLKRSLDNDTCLALINFGSSKVTVNLTELYPDLEEDLQVMLDSSNSDVEKENDEDHDNDIENDAFVLAANAAAVLCDKDDFPDIAETTTADDTETTTADDEMDVDPVTTTEDSPLTSSTNRPENYRSTTIVSLGLILLLRML